jgi:phasin family protein
MLHCSKETREPEMADQKTETQPAKADAPKPAETTAPAVKAEAPKAAAAQPGAKAEAKAPAAAPKAARAKAPARRKPARKAAAPAKAAPARAAKAARKIVTKTRKIKNEGTQTMKNEANKVADRFQQVFGDVNERARTQIERNTRFAEELTELGRGNVEAIVASTKVAAKGVEKIGHEVAELSRKSFEEASAALRGFAEIKSPTDLFRLQGEFARGQFDTFVAEGAKLSEAMIKLAGDVAEPLAGRYTVAAERVKAAVAL